MERLFEKSRKKAETVPLGFVRYLMNEIHWDTRMKAIKGARGTGKTTLLLQFMKKKYGYDESVLYASLDDIWFAENRLTDLADDFVKRGGKYLLLDEVHKYPRWSIEMKNIYDDHPDLKVAFTGSSLLEILTTRADLSRRADVYELHGLSFREYLNFKLGTDFRFWSLDELLENHREISGMILKEIKPLKYFDGFLKEGYYPFFTEDPELYLIRLGEIINMILEVELPMLRKMDISAVPKIKKLLYMIAESAPFVPNISKLSERAGLDRITLLNYLHFLNEAKIIRTIYKEARGISRLQKPDKILMDNTNISWAISTGKPEAGSLRESFFISQAGNKHQVDYASQGDYIIDNTYLFEIGGKNKSSRQLSGWDPEKSFVLADNVEYGFGNRIPLWIMGFLY